jgi:RHS repeat-associated protein
MRIITLRKQSKVICFCLIFFVANIVTLRAQVIPPSIELNKSTESVSKPIDLSKPIGEIAGNVSTTPTGGVNYAIPIFVSPGTNGMQPSISLVYNSQSFDGIAGLGWNLSGLSMISRAGKNFYHNGKVQAVTYTSNDMFLMDGTKLNPITGSNGADGTVYACENENFTKIISNTTSNPNNPNWFKVISNDGTIMEYGNTSDSKFLTDDGLNIMFWRLNKVIDVNGNYIEYKYETIARDIRLKQIAYTGNTNAGLLPYNFIDFSYDYRYDINTSYEAGASISSGNILKSIKVTHTQDDGQQVTIRKYVLNHTYDNIRTKLTEIVEYAGEQTAPSLNSTAFTYGEENTQPVASFQSNFMPGNEDLFSGDFNGDGKADVLAAAYHYFDGAKVYSGYTVSTNLDNQGVGNFIYASAFSEDGVMNTYMNSDIGGLFSADYNKDGRDDVIFLSGHIVEYGQTLLINKVILKTTGSFNPQTGYYSVGTQTFDFPNPTTTDYNYQLTSANGKNFITGDFDGDGNNDYILIARNYNNNLYKAFFTSPATNEVNFEIQNLGIGGSNNAQSVSEADRIIPIDFDGDGKTELLIIKDNNTYIITFNRLAPSTGLFMVASVVYSTQIINKNCRAFPGDFNGDKKTDLLVHYSDNNWGILYSDGKTYHLNADGFVFQKPVLTIGYEISPINKVVVADFNGDGKSDILHGYTDYYYLNNASFPRLALYYSKGKNLYSNFVYEQYNNTFDLGYPNLAVGDFNADGRADIISSAWYDVNLITIKQFGQEKLLTNITTGHNVSTDFQYKLLTDKLTYPWFYDRTISQDDPSNTNPYNYVQVPMYALHKTIVADGIGGNNITEFFYENALVHRAAKGLLGFEKITSKNNVTGITSISQNAFNTEFAVSYPVKQTKKITATNFLLAETFIDNSFINLSTGFNDKRFIQHVDKNSSFDYLNGKAIEIANTYDNYGNVTTSINKIGYGTYNNIAPIETIATTTTFGVHNTNVPAKANNVIISNTRLGKPTISKTNTFNYDNLGRLISQTDFAGLPKATTNTLTYNSFGNVLTSVKSVAGLIPLTNTNGYDSKGRFVIQKQIGGGTNTQTETFVIDSKWGVTISNTTSDCLTTSCEYDVFGRLNKTILPNGNFVTLTNTWQINGNNLFYATEHSSGGSPDKKKYFDKWGKTWKEETASMASTTLWHTVLTTYDNRGNIKTKTNSYFPNIETARITTNNFDTYNRPTTTVNYKGTTTYAYTQQGQGKMKLTVTATDGNSTAQITDATSKVVASIDNGGTLNFDYNSIGNQTEVNNNGVIVLSSVYDVYGTQTSMTDIDAGTTTYVFDNYNKLSSQTDAKGNNYTFTYDDLGRMLTRTGTEGTTTYEYYNDLGTGCKNNNLKKVTGFNGIIKDYTYDVLKRLQSITETGVPGNITSRTTSYSYDANSLLASTTYPSGVAIFNTYDANGYLIRKGTSSLPRNGTLLFYNPEIDGQGRYKSYTLGNGKVTTKTYNNDYPASSIAIGVQNLTYSFQASSGNLLQRNDVLKSQLENFTYDNLNRLRTSTVNSLLQGNVTYDGANNSSMGNINTKTDAGYYTYLNTKKHAVAFVTNTPTPTQTAITPAPSSIIAYTEQIISYTSFLKPESINDGGMYGGPTTNFEYGPDYERVETITYLGRSPFERRYFAEAYEEQEKGLLYDRSLVYVSAGDGLCAILVKENGIVSQYFTYTDYLGSILTVTDKQGAIVAANNFDAWGRERNPDNWNVYTANLNNPTWLYRGYTGHEMLSGFSLINMNSRLYDPILGRMLSPDNYVANANSTQGYNRYSYALNNPLVYTDPDGNIPVLAVIAIFAAVHVTSDLIRHDFKMNFTELVGSSLTGIFSGALSTFGAGAITTGGGALVTAVAAELPGLNMPIADGFSISLSPIAAFGSGGWAFGGSISVHASIDGFELGFGVGGDYGKNATTGVKGFTSRTSSMFGFRSGDLSLGIGQSDFNSGITSQSVGMAYVGVGDFRVRYENDWMWPGSSLGDHGDRYRTTAATLSYKDLSMGLNLFTGAPELDNKGKRISEDIGGGRKQYVESGTPYRMGALYIGFGNTRVGVNTEGVRNFFQNQVAHKNGYVTSTGGLPIFKVLNISDKPYIHRQTSNPFTSW